MESLSKSNKKINRDRVRIRTNRDLQTTSLEDTKWKSVSAPIARKIHSIANAIIEDEGYQKVKFSDSSMKMLIQIAQQFITLGASEIQANVEHSLRHTAIDTDVNIAKCAFVISEGLLPSPAQCDVSIRYINHSDRSKAEIAHKSNAVKKRFVSLSR